MNRPGFQRRPFGPGALNSEQRPQNGPGDISSQNPQPSPAAVAPKAVPFTPTVTPGTPAPEFADPRQERFHPGEQDQRLHRAVLTEGALPRNPEDIRPKSVGIAGVSTDAASGDRQPPRERKLLPSEPLKTEK